MLLACGYRWQKYDPIGYLPDFVSDIWCVAVEVDGGIHNVGSVKRFDRQKARRRMQQAGYHTIRLSEGGAKARPILNVGYVIAVSMVWRVLRFVFYR
jgi:very-short-patch-repair endonuclease